MLKRVCKTGGLGWHVSCSLEATWKDLKEALKKAAMPDTSRCVQLCPASWEKSAGDAPVASTSSWFPHFGLVHSSIALCTSNFHPMILLHISFPHFYRLSSLSFLYHLILIPVLLYLIMSHTCSEVSLLTCLHFFLVMICTQTICLHRLWFRAKHWW